MALTVLALALPDVACAEGNVWLEYARGDDSARLAWPEGGKRPVVVVDFGPDCEGGYPEFEATAVEGRPVVRISYACHPGGLCDTGDFYYETRATYLGKSVDLPILPASVNRFDLFTVTNAGRYASPLAQGLVRYARLALDTPGTAVTIKRFSLANRGVYATERKVGSFDCSDARLATIWRMSVRTCELSAIPARTKPLHVVSTLKPACDVWLAPSYAYLADGAKRDRLVWSGDLWWAQRNMYAAYGYDSPYMPGSLRMLAENRTPEGYVQACPYPESHGPLKAGDWGPFASDEFAAWFVPITWDHILHSGDRALAKELYPVVCDLVRYLRAHCRADGIFEQRRETSKHASALDFGEASTHHRAYMNILNWKVYVDAAKIAEWLGDGARAAEWRTASETLAAAIRRVFWDAGKGRFKGAIETDNYWGEANGLALAAKFCTADEAAAIRKTLVRHGHGKFQALFVRGLYEYGYADDAVQRIFEHGWDDVLDESWKGPRLTSECMTLHTKGWGDEAHPDTAIAGILSNYILGVEPTEPGYAKYRVNPHPSKGVTSASGVVPTPWGALHVSWKLENGKPVVNCREARNDDSQATANLLENPTFDAPPPAAGGIAGWNMPSGEGRTSGGKFSLATGEGRNGTKAMKWDASASNKLGRLSQRVRVKPGRHYRFEAWVRAEGLKCSEHGATIWLDWCDEKGKYLGETYLFGVRGPDSDWRKVEGVTSRLPTNAAYAVFMAGVEAGTAGVAYFDDFRLCEVVDNPIPLLVSDRYRDAAHDGNVTFSAALDLKAAGLDLGKARGEFSYRAADGAMKRVPAETLSVERATISLPVEGFAIGRHAVTFHLLGADGRETGKASIAFTRLSSPPGWRVTIDRHRRVVVDGKLFFPIGLYNGGLSKGHVEKYWKGSPFNCIMPYSMPTQDDVDFAYANGLMAMVSLKDAFVGAPHCPKEIVTEADAERFVAKAVAKFKDRPGLLAWYVNDEADIGKAAQLSARRDLLERLDPNHPTWGVIYQIYDAHGYVRTADVQGSDPYPIPGDIGKCLLHARKMCAGSMGTRAVWQVPQIFDWSQYHKPPRPGERAPTENEMRSMFWQAIAGGANGLVCYAYHCLWAMKAKDPFEKRWAECCKVAGEVKALTPMLLSDPAEFRFRGDVPSNLGVRAWSYEGGKALLFVNAGRDPLEATLLPTVRVRAPEHVFGDGAVSRRNGGALSVSLPPIGVAIVKIQELKE